MIIASAVSGLAQTFTFSTAKRGPLLGDMHYGIFYEEINHAGDGGLYAELIRNRSMEENGSNPDFWWPIQNGKQSISTSTPMNPSQTRYMKLVMTKAGDGTRNEGYWGINLKAWTTYKVSFWVRTLDRWNGELELSLERQDGTSLGKTTVQIEPATDTDWKKYTTTIVSTDNEEKGWFAIRGSKAGTIYLDMVSLFPPTYKNRENGCRKDLAEMLAKIQPKFMRFPGGCFIEGGNRFQWKNSVGPIEKRQGIYNSHWGYPVTNGMGFHEFLQLCEDMGTEPLFVVNIGLGHGWYENYQHLGDYIQEALDAVEYANGDVTTRWGRLRAEMGHPEPFNLRMLEIGNENYNNFLNNNNDQSDHYPERYWQFYQAIKAKYPYMTCIGNINWSGDYPTWRCPYPVDLVDEHFYRNPDWFASMYHHYDHYSRTSHGVYVGEYAVTSDFGGGNGDLRSALGEAIFMAGMEVNSDVVRMTSYAPIFSNEAPGATQWVPDMIHYNSAQSFGTPSYWAQQMMSSNCGHQNLTWTEQGNDAESQLYLCASLNKEENEAIVKIINYGGEQRDITLAFADATINGNARTQIMTGADAHAQNTMSQPTNVAPKSGTAIATQGSSAMPFSVVPYSLNILRIPLTDVQRETVSYAEAPTPTVCFTFDNNNADDITETYSGTMNGKSRILPLDDGNLAFYTGLTDENGYLSLNSASVKKLAELASTGEFSISLNIMPQEPGNFASYSWALALGINTDNYLALINMPNNQNWYAETVHNGSAHLESGSGLQMGKWHNITFTQQGRSQKIYVDGQLRNQMQTETPITINTAVTQFYLGKSFFSADPTMATAWFDDVMFFNHPITDDEVAAIWNDTKTKCCTSQLRTDLYNEYALLSELKSSASKVGLSENVRTALAQANSAIRTYNGQHIDNDEVLAALQQAREQLLEAIATERQIKMGADIVGQRIDITSLLVNPDFADGSNGWQGTNFTAAPGTVAEHYWKLFDNYQTLQYMPAGTYELSIKGFYRNGNKESAYLAHTKHTETLTAEYYLSNSNSEVCAPFMSLYDESTNYIHYNYPDNVQDAENAFHASNFFQNDVISLDLTQTDNLTIGLRKRSYVPADWTCFDDVRLFFIPANATAISDIEQRMNNSHLPIHWYTPDGRPVSPDDQRTHLRISDKGKKIVRK